MVRLARGSCRSCAKSQSLPCHVRVVSPGPSVARDLLCGTDELRLENIVIEQCLIAKDEASLENTESVEDTYRDWPEAMFEISTERLGCEVLVVLVSS